MDIRQYLIDCARSLTGALRFAARRKVAGVAEGTTGRFWEMLGIDAYMKGRSPASR